ncbi:hypothetical protein [Campylobacter canadensis]|uniref:Uncharacterized protein n=1 Tax=Campylobacter canadensis TaxID=449520 RepID=A0ABS7WS38_9BACT|nr:hypothetical protein [Campylobacter canadensis]MBZ7987569.1 hypothetical protein [Campylobacter canadensis]MBZ7998675.1 hypothetical protein [Campylobacter canadensis]
MKFKEIKNITNILCEHNKKFLFLKFNQRLQDLIKIMPIDIKSLLTQSGVVCDIFFKNNKKILRIRTKHPAITQQLKLDSNKKQILQVLKIYKKYGQDKYIKEISDEELIIQTSLTLKKSYDKISHQVIISPIKSEGEFKNIATKSEHALLVDKIKKNIKKRNIYARELIKNH